ncbi:MAG: hypothetical protein IJF18_02115 [Oscillospiraceae bacterium]|nr:hypothetical protein [Oscillospiraceae bacterium]
MRPKELFEFLYAPYSETVHDDFALIYDRYKTDPKSTIEINGITFYHALQIIRTNIRGRALIAALDNRLDLKINDILIDENGKEYIVKGFEMLRFQGDIPEWYSKISMVALIGDVDNVGCYFAKKYIVNHKP